MQEMGITLGEIDAVVVNQDSKANLWRKIGFTLARRPDLSLVIHRLKNKRQRGKSVAAQLEEVFFGQAFVGKVIPVQHHLAHLSSAFHVAPFDEAIVVSIDGFGDFASGEWGVGRGAWRKDSD